jgi:hypothetical protein
MEWNLINNKLKGDAIIVENDIIQIDQNKKNF